MSITLEQQPPLAQRLIARIGAMRFFSVSLLLHLILVISLGGVVIIKKATETPDFEGDGDFVVGEAQEPGPPPAPEIQQPNFQPTVAPVAPPVQTMAALTTTSTVTPTFSISAMPAAMPNLSNKLTDSSSMTEAVKAMPKVGATALPSMMAARASGSSRRAAMSANKGKDKSEQAVLQALRWLQSKQNPDGSWGDRYKSAMAGLALLSFLGHGETNASAEFGACVGRAIDYLVKFKNAQTTSFNAYEHGIAIYALAEAYTMTKLESIEPPLRKGIDVILKGQTSTGGWPGSPYNYTVKEGGEGSKTLTDTSVLGWQVQALKAAHLTGLNIPGVDESISKAMNALKLVRGPKGGFGYNAPQDRYSLTGAGALCVQIAMQLKEPKESAPTGSILDRGSGSSSSSLALAPLKKLSKEAVDFILEPGTPGLAQVKYKEKDANLYAWYYNTQACLNRGGAAWAKWNSMFQDEIVKNQSSDGSWPETGEGKAGTLHWNGTGTGPTAEVYRTSLCTLMLEVFYRYLPSSK